MSVHPIKSAKVKRPSISKRLRFEVFKRDSFTCQYCGKSAPEVVLHIDHISPVAGGGDSDIMNLITSCVSCNLGKGARQLDDRSVITKQ
jgi:5-methylcytosine-specific restriction endonuclease McrA